MLFIVATPIGNLEDVTLRALRTLKEVDLIAAEDTRQIRKLLDRYGIKTKTVSFHQHSKDARLHELIELMQSGAKVALVTDAGTPGVSDPGGVLVAEANKAGIQVAPIPGANTIATILSVAGIPADAFFFVGFLPTKKGRVTLWKEIKNLAVPVILFESPHRIIKTLQEISHYLGDRKLIVGRELTKLHEQILRDSTKNLLEYFTEHPPKGEFVIIIT